MSDEFLVVPTKQLDIKLLYAAYLDVDGEEFFARNLPKLSERRKLQLITTNAEFCGSIRNPETRFWYMYTLAIGAPEAFGPPIVFQSADGKTMTSFFNVERIICGLFVNNSADEEAYRRIWPSIPIESWWNPYLDEKMNSSAINFKDPSRIKFIFGDLFVKAWDVLNNTPWYHDYSAFINLIRTSTNVQGLLNVKNESSGLVANTFLADELHAGTIKSILVGITKARGTTYAHAVCTVLVKQLYGRLSEFAEKTGVVYMRLSLILAYTLSLVGTLAVVLTRYPTSSYYKYHIKHEPADLTRDAVLLAPGKDNYKMCIYDKNNKPVAWWQIFPHTTSDEIGAFCSLSSTKPEHMFAPLSANSQTKTEPSTLQPYFPYGSAPPYDATIPHTVDNNTAYSHVPIVSSASSSSSSFKQPWDVFSHRRSRSNSPADYNIHGSDAGSMINGGVDQQTYPPQLMPLSNSYINGQTVFAPYDQQQQQQQQTIKYDVGNPIGDFNASLSHNFSSQNVVDQSVLNTLENRGVKLEKQEPQTQGIFDNIPAAEWEQFKTMTHDRSSGPLYAGVPSNSTYPPQTLGGIGNAPIGANNDSNMPGMAQIKTDQSTTPLYRANLSVDELLAQQQSSVDNQQQQQSSTNNQQQPSIKIEAGKGGIKRASANEDDRIEKRVRFNLEPTIKYFTKV